MRNADNLSRASILWVLLLTAASTATTLLFACATPFPALAALAALHMRRRDGVILMLAAWTASQLVGFCLLDYPHDVKTIFWGCALATAAVGSVIGSHAALDRIGTIASPLRLVAAYCAAFLAFKLVVLVWSVGLGGVATTLDPAILARQFGRNGALLLLLLAFYHALIGVGLPTPRPRPVTA